MSELDNIREKTSILVNDYNDFTILSKEDYQKAGDVIKRINTEIKRIDEKRKIITVPMDVAKKAVMKDYKDLINPLKEIVSEIKESMVIFHEEQEKVKQEARQKLMNDKEIDTEDIKDITKKTERGDVSTTTMREIRTFEIIDIKQVPRDYLILNEPMVRNAMNNDIEVPGIKLVIKKSPTIR